VGCCRATGGSPVSVAWMWSLCPCFMPKGSCRFLASGMQWLVGARRVAEHVSSAVMSRGSHVDDCFMRLYPVCRDPQPALTRFQPMLWRRHRRGWLKMPVTIPTPMSTSPKQALQGSRSRSRGIGGLGPHPLCCSPKGRGGQATVHRVEIRTGAPLVSAGQIVDCAPLQIHAATLNQCAQDVTRPMRPSR